VGLVAKFPDNPRSIHRLSVFGNLRCAPIGSIGLRIRSGQRYGFQRELDRAPTYPLREDLQPRAAPRHPGGALLSMQTSCALEIGMTIAGGASVPARL